MSEYVTQRDLDTYGHEFLNATRRVTNTVVEPRLQNLERQLAVERRKRLDDQVAAAVPDYKEVDRNPAWHRWLLGIDALSGRVRQILLNDAIQAGDAARIKFFFDSFKREAGGASAQAPAATRSRTTRSAPIGERTYTREQIADLYSRHRRGEFDKRESYWKELEADIFQAQHDNRILAHPYLTK